MKSIALLVVFASVSLAQDPYGRITGRVFDGSGAVLPSVGVRVTNLETGVAINTTSNAEGNFELTNLTPGRYRVDADAQGFKHYTREAIDVHVGDVIKLDVSMVIGAQTESVTVTSEAPLLEAANASLSQVIESRQLQDLPVAGGTAMYLALLAPGVMSTNAPTHGWFPLANESISAISTAGNKTQTSQFNLDGIPNMTQAGSIAFAPPVEMIAEFRVQTTPFDASVGRFTGSNIDMVIRSGANQFHGNIFAQHTSRMIQSRTPFSGSRETVPFTRTNHYRGAISGPVYIPKIYDGHNKTFWTYGGDQIQRSYNSPGLFTVPTVAERSGDFSALLAISSSYTIYDPATITPTGTGRFSRTAFAGNRIPASRLDPLAQKLLGFWDLPNLPGTNEGRQNYASAQPSSIAYHGQTWRADHFVSDRHRMFGTLTWGYDEELSVRMFPATTAVGTIKSRRERSLALDNVFTVRPNLVVDVRYGFTRYKLHLPHLSFGTNPADLGFTSPVIRQLEPALATIPNITIDGYQSIGGSSAVRTFTNYHSLGTTVSYVRGTHTIRTGGEFRVLQENGSNFAYVSPQIQFSTGWTRGPLDTSPASAIGQGLASFLLGVPTGGFIDKNASYAEQSRYTGVFVQDDWKVSRNLTLNLGLRYELEFPTTERYNRANRGFDLSTTNPISAAAAANYARSSIAMLPPNQFRTLGGPLFMGQNGVPSGLFEMDKNNFAPRFGFAWNPRPDFVVRGGYAIFFGSLGADRTDVLQQGFSQRTQIIPSTDNGEHFQASLTDPFPSGVLTAPGASLGLRTYLGQGVNFFDPGQRTNYVQRWTLNIQRQFKHGVLVEIGYVGNRATGLAVDYDRDGLPNRYLSTSPVRDQPNIDALQRPVTNPFYGIPEFAGTPLGNPTVQTQQLLKPFPHFNGITGPDTSGFSSYHGLVLRLEKRFSHGFNLHGAYTWSKFMEAIAKLNPGDPGPSRVISDQDRPQHLVISGTYELPFGKKRHWLNSGDIVDAIAGGWSLSAIYQAQSGPPIGFGNILFRGDLHDIVLPADQRTIARWFNTDAGFDRASGNQLLLNVRTFPLRLTGLRANGINTWDLSASKNFKIWERLTLQIRADAQDAFNHPLLSAPNSDPVNSAFGRVSGTIWGEQRKVFLGARIMW